MKKALAAAAVILALLLSGCGTSAETPAQETASPPSSPPVTATEPAAEETPEPEEPTGLSQIFPFIDGCTGVYVNYGFTSRDFFGGQVYVAAGEQAANDIVALLKDADISAFSEYSGELMGASVPLKIENASGAGYITLMLDGENLYFSITSDSDSSRKILKGPAQALDYASLTELSDAVLAVADDPSLCASVRTLTTDEEPRLILAAHTAKLVNILDGTAASGVQADSAAFSPEIELEYSETIWQLDAASGIFSRSAGGNTEYYQLDTGWLTHVLTLIGGEVQS